MWRKCLLTNVAACIVLWLFLAAQALPQSVVGAGTIPFLRLGQETGSGIPQGVLAGAGHVVHGVPVGALRVRLIAGGTIAAATADVDCIHSDGERIVFGGPIRAGSVPGPIENTHLYLIVEDNGAPVGGRSVDRALAIASTQDFCEDADILIALFDFFYAFTSLNHGNFIVRHDTP